MNAVDGIARPDDAAAGPRPVAAARGMDGPDRPAGDIARHRWFGDCDTRCFTIIEGSDEACRCGRSDRPSRATP